MPLTTEQIESLNRFYKENKFTNKGKLCVALVVTDHAREKGLPLEPEDLVAKSGGQVVGLGVGKVQKILARHGIKKVLAKEGGRTSRGSMRNMKLYVAFLNSFADSSMIDSIEAFWIEKVRIFMQGKPFQLNLDPTRSMRMIIKDLLDQAKKRKGDGTHYHGAVLQHLVGAKLELVLGDQVSIAHHSFSTSDQQSGRAGDYLVHTAAIHVTVNPQPALLDRCRKNLDDALRPIIITVDDEYLAACVMVRKAGLAERVDVFEIEQFMAATMYELSLFDSGKRRVAVAHLFEKYNAIVEDNETDPSLKVEIKK